MRQPGTNNRHVCRFFTCGLPRYWPGTRTIRLFYSVFIFSYQPAGDCLFKYRIKGTLGETPVHATPVLGNPCQHVIIFQQAFARRFGYPPKQLQKTSAMVLRGNIQAICHVSTLEISMESSKWSHFRMRTPQKQWFSIHDPAGSQGISPKSWISDSLGPQTARVTVQPKRNWPSPFEVAAVEVVANLEGLYEKPATSHPQKGFKFDTFLCSKVCVTCRSFCFIYFLMAPPFWSLIFSHQIRPINHQKLIRKTHLFGSHEAEVFFSFRMLPASKGTSSGDPLWLKVFLGNFPPRHYPTTEPPKTSTKTATCQCRFRIFSFSNSVSGCLKKHHCNHWWLKLFRCLFLSRICSLNSDVLRLRWHSRSLVMDPQQRLAVMEKSGHGYTKINSQVEKSPHNFSITFDVTFQSQPNPITFRPKRHR